MKSVARLTGSLLARKGFAMPAQESAAYALSHDLPHEITPPARPFSATYARAPEPAPEPAPEIAPEPKPRAAAPVACAAPAEVSATPTPATPTSAAHADHGKRVAMTLRLDNDRHLKLRVLSAHSNLSSQEILTAALDDYLARYSAEPGLRHCECLHQGVAPGKACR